MKYEKPLKILNEEQEILMLNYEIKQLKIKMKLLYKNWLYCYIDIFNEIYSSHIISFGIEIKNLNKYF